jgi:hypothetical protein
LQLSGGGASTVPKDVQVTDETRKSPSAPESQRVPVLPLRDVVVYPHMVIPLFVGRDKSILALDEAMRRDKRRRDCRSLPSSARRVVAPPAALVCVLRSCAR